MDQISTLWVEKNRTLTSLLPQSLPPATPIQTDDVTSLPPRGWALKENATPSRKCAEVKKFLEEIWQAGECTGMKADAAHVSQLMRTKTGPDGSRLFPPQQWLSARQIMSYFSRLTASKGIPNVSTSDSEELVANMLQDVESAEVSECTQNLLSML